MKFRPFILLGTIFCSLACTSPAQAPQRVYENYRISAAEENEAEQKWADYLRAQLNRRMDQTNPTLLSDPADQTLEITIDLDKSLSAEYAIRRQGNQLTLRAQNEEILLWMLYQCIADLADDDPRIAATDLPPALLNIHQNSEGSFRFEYRGIYSPSNTDPDAMAIQASHNVDYDWGLWGHNLRKIVGTDPDETLYAWHENHRDNRQFCFSSEALFRRLESFILDNYGDGLHGPGARGSRFCIMPEDNSIVCLCDKCQKAGNSSPSATPAVCNLLTRLAKRFPHHLFFTTAYRTTAQAPVSSMPENSGVIISAIHLPLAPLATQRKEVQAFQQELTTWHAVTSRIYMWDYMRNFDDYLTPFPALGLLKQRLDLFEQNGVSGVFYNGSGYDYASLDDVQTFVLSALLKTPQVDCDTLIRTYLARFYPQSGEIIYPYYRALEQRVSRNQALLPYYGGIEESIRAYLKPNEFAAFFQALSSRSKTIEGEERSRLNRLLTALNFTMLELMRTPLGIPYDALLAEGFQTDLQGHQPFPEMNNYREANGSLETYLADWHHHPIRSTTPEGFRYVPATCYDPDGQPLTMLSDRYYGLPSDYHTGWYPFKQGELTAEAEMQRPGTLRIQGCFLYAPTWKIDLPEHLHIFINGEKVQELSFSEELAPFSKQPFRLERKVAAGDLLKIVITPSRKPGFSVACDEIEIYEHD